MKFMLAILPLLFLVGCSSRQHCWRIEQGSVPAIARLDVEPAIMPAHIGGDRSLLEEAEWKASWPDLFAKECKAGFDEEARLREGESFTLEFTIDAISVGGSAWSNGLVSGRARILRRDGSVAAVLAASWAEGRGHFEPAATWFRHMGMQLARLVNEAR
jgi:hypothetical protein